MSTPSACPACPASQPLRLRLDARGRLQARCSVCGTAVETTASAPEPGDGLRACLNCGEDELYAQKDFPRWLGFAIVGIAALLAPFTHYLSLVVAALLDWILFHTRGEILVCYACSAQHEGFPNRPRHPRFDREIAERRRFGAHAVMGKQKRAGGTADAPEPEH